MDVESDRIIVYLETGQKRVFAGAIDWPGWCRAGRDETSALQALFETGPRYQRAILPAGLGFHAPKNESAFVVVERLEGNASTDFGAPDASPSQDALPVPDAELRRFQTLLEACWHAFDEIQQLAQRRELRKGPRGGGRDLEGMIQHVLGSDLGYLSALGWKPEISKTQNLQASLLVSRQAILDGLNASVQGDIPPYGPRGGKRWTPRYFVRRVAWHCLDHTWEIEDRMVTNQA